MTSVKSPLAMRPDAYTVLMGYHPDLSMFAGFDLARHCTFTAGSPSVQVSIGTIHRALQNGLSFDTKDNDEIVVGVRPDQLIAYILNAADLHQFGSEADIRALLNSAVGIGDVGSADVEQLAGERKRIVTNVTRYSRAASFRRRVLDAYQNRCAVTRAQLRLVEAAHILPVPLPDSSDDVSNGIALSPTYHRAYDSGLIYLDECMVMRLNAKKAKDLRSVNLTGGLDQIETHLGSVVHLPMDAILRPNPEYVRRANKHRCIPGYK